MTHRCPANAARFRSLIGTECRDRRYIELRLLHVFTVEVCPTFPACLDKQNFKAWTCDVPRLAMDYEPLLHAIMSISLLYAACCGTRLSLSAEELFTLRAQNFEATLQGHRKSLAAMDRNIADSASFTTVILLFDSFASLRERRAEMESPYKPPTAWLQMCKGVENVVGTGLTMLSQDPNSVISTLPKGLRPLYDRKTILSDSNRARFSHLLAPHGDDEIYDETDMEAYTAAAAHMGSIVAAQESGEDRLMTARRLAIFPVLLQPRFNSLLDQLRPRALVILAHYFAMASSFDWLWWIGDSPVREFAAIESHLSAEWRDLMEWPLQIIHRNRRSSSSASTG